MTRDEIIKLAREAGLKDLGGAYFDVVQFGRWDGVLFTPNELERFAALVAAAEREACANIVENANTPDCGGWSAQGIADDIRVRNN